MNEEHTNTTQRISYSVPSDVWYVSAWFGHLIDHRTCVFLHISVCEFAFSCDVYCILSAPKTFYGDNILAVGPYSSVTGRNQVNTYVSNVFESFHFTFIVQQLAFLFFSRIFCRCCAENWSIYVKNWKTQNRTTTCQWDSLVFRNNFSQLEMDIFWFQLQVGIICLWIQTVYLYNFPVN